MNRTRIVVLAPIVLAALLNACSSADTSTNTVSTEAAGTTNAAATTAAATTAQPAATTEAAATTEPAEDPTASSDTTAAVAGDDATPAIVAAANAFIATLSDTEKGSGLFEWTDEEQKARWSNLPNGMFQRSGLRWGDLGTDAQNAWLAVMQATLSEEGYERVRAEWRADDELGGSDYGQDNYFVAIIGTPSTTDPWQWQWGGHHVTVNATIAGTELSLTPSFIGVQPATYTDEGREVRPLGDITDEAVALVNSLDTGQQAKAVLGSSYIDLVLGPGQDGKTIAPEGLAGADMTADQQAALLALMGEYGNLANAEDGAKRMANLVADIDATYFAWYGPTDTGSDYYFRITGPTIVIEFSPQRMGGDPAEHIHGIYRDPTNDYGAAITG